MADIADTLIAELIEREGGFVDSAVDEGGATKYGITIGTLRDWRRCPVSRDDVINLTIEEASRIYKTNYFIASGFDKIPDAAVQGFLFDFGVNSGVGTATRALQRCIGAKDDGAMGPISFAALKAVNNLEALFYRLKCERFELLLRFIGSHAEQAANAIGWANRLDTFEEKII